MKKIKPKIGLIEGDIYSFDFDLNQFKDSIFNDKSSFKFSMIVPTGFELIDNFGDFKECREYVRNYGDKFEINLQKYYYKRLNKYECSLNIEFKMRPNFKGEIVLPAILIKSNLHKFVSDPMLIQI